jgi:hypothetical protein
MGKVIKVKPQRGEAQICARRIGDKRSVLRQGVKGKNAALPGSKIIL